MSHDELLESELQGFSLELSDEQKSSLEFYCHELERWNAKVNLTALSGASLVRRLVVEPVWIARQLALGGDLTDIGSGNGSPAIPFRIVSSFKSCELIEARTKRAAFLRHVTSRLGFANVSVHRARFEQIAENLRKPDWISIQAVALTDRLIDSIRLMANPTTSIVWITSSRTKTSLTPQKVLEVPLTGTQVSVFQFGSPEADRIKAAMDLS